jgi:tetratricopeptide (TPR) repeat protein
MKRTVAILILLLFPLLLPAASSNDSLAKLFAAGNELYQKGDYGQAEQDYRALIQAGADSASLYYNLGNACFKQKRLGEAIYYWEKARKKRPADPDIRENLEFANLMIVDRIESPQIAYPVRLLNNTLELVSTSQLGWITLILFAAANAFLIWHILARRRALSPQTLIGSINCGVLFIFFAGALSWKIYVNDYRKEGVIVEQKVEVHSGPGADNLTIFTIHEGVKVQVRESGNGWLQVSLPNGWNGWLPQSAVALLW